jgi:hypothetical protein
MPPMAHVLKVQLQLGTWRWWNLLEVGSSGEFQVVEGVLLKGAVTLCSPPLSLFSCSRDVNRPLLLCAPMTYWATTAPKQLKPPKQ